MTLDRRNFIHGVGGLAATAAFSGLGPATTLHTLRNAAPDRRTDLPRKQDFDIADGCTFLNAAYTHPIPRPAADAVRAYLDTRSKLRNPMPGSGGGDGPGLNPKALFAELINAKPSEIAWVPNTSTGENLVLNALGLDRRVGASRGNVVSDWLHYDGALVHLLELKKRGLNVRIVKPTKECRIDLRDIEKVVDKNTKLIQLSSTAMYNGFQHDLKAVCELAHARGAYVYADIIHTAGAEPLDVKASGVDFAACSTFKWLMGDYGLGFLYAREELLDTLDRSQVGYYQTSDMTGHEPPFDSEGAGAPVSWEFKNDAAGHFEVGSIGGALRAGLGASLAYIKEIGVSNIQAYRQPLLKRLRLEMPRLGFICVTPPESTAGIITFAKKNVGGSDVPRKLDAAKVNVRVATHWLRVSPSIYNDMTDIERLLEALA